MEMLKRFFQLLTNRKPASADLVEMGSVKKDTKGGVGFIWDGGQGKFNG